MTSGSHGTRPRSLINLSVLGAATMIAGSGGRLALQFLMLAVLARILSPADFGLVGATTVVMGIGEILVTIGFGAALVQRPKLTTEHIRTAFTVTMFLGLILTMAVFLLSGSIAALFRIPELANLVKLGSLMLLIKSSAIVAEALMFRKKKFKALASVLFLSNFAGLVVVGLPLALAGFGAWALVAATLTTAAVTAASLLLLAPHAKRPQFDRRAAAQLLRYGLGQSIASIFNSLSRHADNFVVARVLGVEALGLYGRAYQIMSLPGILIGDAIRSVFFPVFSDVQDDQDRLSRGYRVAIAAIAIGVAPASVLLAILAPDLVRIVLGPGWDAIVTPLQILSAAMMFRVGQKLSDALVKAKAAVYRRATLVGLFAASVFSLAWFGANWGLAGVAVGILVAIIGYYLAMGIFAARLSNTPIPTFLAAHIGGLTMSAIVGAVALPTSIYLRGLSLNHLSVVILTTLASLLIVLIVLRLAPRAVLGRTGLEASACLFGSVPRLHPLQRMLIPALRPN